MEWIAYIACLLGGAFSANGIPHFVQGISGNSFPTPFSKPRGIGLSPAFTNVIWGLFNFAIAWWLLNGKIIDPITTSFRISLDLFLFGFFLMSILLSIRFAKKHKE
jgi:hypothetical protein